MGCNYLVLMGVLEQFKGCYTWVYYSTFKGVVLGCTRIPQGVLHFMHGYLKNCVEEKLLF